MAKGTLPGDRRKRLFGGSVLLGVLAGAGAAPAVAQDTTPAEGDVIITGSRIPHKDIVAAGPVTSIGAEAIARSSSTSVDQLLQALPTVAGDVSGDTTNNGGYGTSNISLRGLDPERTLVLINGQRATPGGGLTTIGGVSPYVDLTSIPLGMIDRIEVYQDGASAVYGSDAIAGVVNIIFKNNFNGVQASSELGVSNHGDGEKRNYEAVFGASSDRAHALFGIGYLDQDAISQSARSFSHCAKQEVTPGDVECVGSYNSVGGFAFNVGGGGTVTHMPGYGGAQYITWIDGPSSPREFDPATDTFNFAGRSFLSQPSKRWSVTGSGDFDVGMGIKAFADGYFTDRKSVSQQAPDPTGPSPGHDVQGFFIPHTNPYNHTGYDLYMYRRPLELGDRVYDTNVQTFRITAGLRGDFGTLVPTWKWEVSALHGESDTSSSGGPLLLMGNANIAMDPALCAADTTCAGFAAQAGQTAINPFGPDTINPAWIPYISAVLHDISNNSLTVYQTNAHGNITELPAGTMKGAVGVEYINNAGYYKPDFMKTTGQTDEAAEPTAGAFHSTEYYGELDIPLLKDQPFAKGLDLGLAARHAKYSTGNHAITWKSALNWDLSSQFRLRGIVSQATRVPSIVDLYKGPTLSFEFATDPCTNYDTTYAPSSNRYQNCVAEGVPAGFAGANAGQIPTTFTNNPTLKPETARTYTFGFVAQPEIIPDLKVSVDYWKYKINNYIDTLDTTELLNLCYDGPVGLTSPYCADHTGRNAIHQIDGNINPLQNLGYIKTDGIDFDAGYTFRDLGPGNLELKGLATYMHHWIISPNGIDVTDHAGTAYSGYIYAHWRGSGDVAYNMDWGGLSLHERWVGKADDVTNPTSAYFHIPNVFYSDLEGYVNYKAARWTVGVDNVFDKQPPFFASYNDENTDAGSYDTTGRFFWTRISVKM